MIVFARRMILKTLALICVSVSFNLLAAAQAPGTINPLIYPGANLCLQIQAAIAANQGANPQGLIIDARSATGTQQCTVNPLSGATVPGQLLLGATVLQTTATIVTPSVPAWQILGIGRGNNVNLTGTLIRAVSGFPANSPVVRLGDGTNLTFGNRIENLAIDCNNIPGSGVTGSTGLYSSDIQEESGGNYLVISGCQSRGLWINGSGVGEPPPSPYTAGVPTWADNYEFHDDEVYGSASSPSLVACEFDGNFTHQGNGPHTVNALTCSHATTAFVFDGISASTLTNLNAEFAATGYLIGNNAPLNGVTFEGLNSSTISQTVVHIKKVVTSTSPPNFTQGVSFSSIVNGGAATPTTVQDDIQGVTLTDFIVGSYSIGSQLPSGLYSSLSSSPNSVSNVPQLKVDNGADLANILKFGAGSSSQQAAVIEYDNRGLPKWNLGMDGSNDFQIFDFSSNVLRFFAPTGAFPYTALSSIGSAPILLNMLGGSGSGGVQFGSGGVSPSTVASVNSTGVATFSSLLIPSLGGSLASLCATTGGLIVKCSAAGSSAVQANTLARSESLSGGVASVFGRTGPVAAASGDYDVTQITGAAPLSSPSFSGTLTSPSIGGSGSASFNLGTSELIGGADAGATCATGHLCDSYSGTVRLITGSNPIASAGTPAVTIVLPFPRQNLPNCIVTIANGTTKRSIPITLTYPNTYSVAIVGNDALAASTGYDITYICGGN